MKSTFSLRAFVWSLLAIVPMALTGCSEGPPPPTDKGQAVTLLKQVLEEWKAGKTPTEVKNGTLAVTVSDTSWTTGAKLIQFEIVESEAQPSGYDLTCPVKLWIGDNKKPPIKTKYVIALKPNRVITRDFGS